MDTLTNPHWETISAEMRLIMRQVGQFSWAARFYLAGGTALALHLGHRRSVDLDFFSEMDDVSAPTSAEIITALAPLVPVVIERSYGNLLLQIGETYTGFFSYHYPLLDPLHIVEGIAVAGVRDIGLMKMDALISRASRKDFYDLYFIAQQIPLPNLLALCEQKAPYARDFMLEALRSLTYFANAELDSPLDTHVEVSWARVKQFFIDEAKWFRREWFDF